MMEWYINSINLFFICYLLGISLEEILMYQCKSVRIRIISKRKRHMKEIKVRNTVHLQEENWVNNKPLVFIFHMLIDFIPKGEGGNRLHQHDIRSRLEFSDLWSRWSRPTSIPRILIDHALGQNLSFVDTPVVNSFKRAKNKLRLSELQSGWNNSVSLHKFWSVNREFLLCSFQRLFLYSNPWNSRTFQSNFQIWGSLVYGPECYHLILLLGWWPCLGEWFSFYLDLDSGWARWRLPFIPAFQWLKQMGFWVLGQPCVYSEFRASQDYTVRPVSKENKTEYLDSSSIRIHQWVGAPIAKP